MCERKKQKTFFLHEPSLRNVDLSIISDLERYFLKTLGADFNIPFLYNIEDYLKPYPRIIYGQKTRTYQSPSLNLNRQ